MQEEEREGSREGEREDRRGWKKGLISFQSLLAASSTLPLLFISASLSQSYGQMSCSDWIN